MLTKSDIQNHQDDIAAGIKASQQLGLEDKGQSVLVLNGAIIGYEDQKGTNALIHRFAQKGAVLVKTCKPQQDKDLDLPTIGLGTLKACLDKEIAGYRD